MQLHSSSLSNGFWIKPFAPSDVAFEIIVFDPWELTIITIILGSFLGTYLSVIFWLAGFKYTISGRAAIYNQLSTILIIVLAFFILKEPMSKKKWFGVLLSITGALLVSLS